MIAIVTPSRTGELRQRWRDAVSATMGRHEYEIYSCRDMPTLDARNFTTTRAYNEKAELFWFLDDDVIPPINAFDDLCSANVPIISGMVTNKSPRAKARVARIDGSGMYRFDDYPWQWPGEPFEVDSAGMGCLLVRRDVLDMIEPDRWFNWNYPRRLPDGRVMMQSRGEDLHFCVEANRAGFDVYAHPNVRCQHIDWSTGHSFPDERYWADHRRKTS
ncbi:MAG TPA: hypothetical protein VMX74_02985 [Pirellulales bacterium]|nr:hypothetical protein [Pirellulales bacterium]